MRVELEKEVTSVFSVTPENKFCLTCPQMTCKGACEEFKAYMKQKRETANKGKKPDKEK